MLDENESLVALVDRIVDVAGPDQIKLEELVQAVGHASFTPMLLVPAIALATPLSGIPLFSSFMGVLIFLVSVQMLLRRDHLWLPQWLLHRKADSSRVKGAFKRIRPAMAWLDAHTDERLAAFFHRPLIFIPQLLCVLSGLILPMLELVPFSSSLIGCAVALLALAMLARDGLYLVLGLIPYGCVAWLVLRII